MGRRRTRLFPLWLSDEEHEMLRKVAAAWGMQLSELLRYMLREEFKKIQQEEAIRRADANTGQGGNGDGDEGHYVEV